ncbi:MAG TPA: hypothetical protein VF765_06615 [Polyangiaceae bacterium]
MRPESSVSPESAPDKEDEAGASGAELEQPTMDRTATPKAATTTETRKKPQS